MQELGPNQREWIAALRSGRYKQTTKALRNKDGFCCLGVGCDVFDPDMWEPDGDAYTFDNEDGALPECVVYHLGLYGANGESKDGMSSPCYEMNDCDGLTFVQIAQRLESDPSEYFCEPR